MPEITPEDIFATQDGSHSILSRNFGVPYHSKYGAIQESQHVFIHHGLNYRLREMERPLHVLEFGFGTGLNAYLTYLIAEKQEKEIHYLGIEAYPLTPGVVTELNYPAQLAQPAAPFLGIHQCPWDKPKQFGDFFFFRKIHDRIEQVQLTKTFDVLYFDAFAPTSQPELWDIPVLEKAFSLLNPGGVLVTYCANGAFKRNLKAVDFKVEALPGPPGKREMTRAVKV